MGGRGGRGHGGNKAGHGNNNNNNASGRDSHGTYWPNTTKVGLNKDLEGNIFDLREHSSANLMCTMQIKIMQYIRSLYAGDIMGELERKKEFITPTPEYPDTARARQPMNSWHSLQQWSRER